MQSLKTDPFMSKLIFVMIMVFLSIYGLALQEATSAETSSYQFIEALVDARNLVIPTVVAINTTRTITIKPLPVSSDESDLPNDHLFRKLLLKKRKQENSKPKTIHKKAIGSGVIISADGHILTVYHLVNKVDKIVVRLPSKGTFHAKIVGKDANTDLAIIKIDKSVLASLPTIFAKTLIPTWLLSR